MNNWKGVTMFKATNMVAKAFAENNWKYTVQEDGPVSYLQATFKCANTSVTFRFISNNDNNDVVVMTDSIARFPEDKRENGLALVNTLNWEYRYVKFLFGSMGDLYAQYDFPVYLGDDEVGKVCIEITTRFLNIIDEAYPRIMKAIRHIA